MAITTGVTRVAANVGLGTQDITIDGFGTPKGAILYMNYATAEGVAGAGGGHSIGFTDGINEFCVVGTAVNGAATTNTASDLADGGSPGLIFLNTPGTTAHDGFAIFDSWIVDGIRIDWTNALSAPAFITAILLGGDDLQVFVGSQKLTNVANTTQTVVNVGFESHMVLTACANFRSNTGLNGANWVTAYGAIHNDGAGGVTQRFNGIRNRDNVGTTELSAILSELYGTGGMLDGGTLDWGGEFSNFTAAGFDITERIRGSNDTEIYYICLAGADPTDFSVGTHETPVAIGNDSEVGPDFEPQLVVLGTTHLEGIDAGASDSTAGSIGSTAFTDTDIYSVSSTSEDGVVANTNEQTWGDAALNSRDDGGGAGVTADFVSFDALGYTLNYTVVTPNAKQFWYAAVKSSPPAVGDTFNEHPWVVPTTWYLPYWKHR